MTGADRDGLEAANAAFYEAFEALDLDRMASLWADDEDVWCVHPGSDLITGWGPVRRSWAAIFASTSYLQFIVTDVRADVRGPAGWVCCTENILSTAEDALASAKVVATNVFVRDHAAWRMVAHHASPVFRGVQS